MKKRRLFGTDGVRGLANQAPMDPETALGLGRALARVFLGRNRHHRIVIGKDTRRSGYMIENALSSGICSMGGEAIFLGPLPTPGTAFITQAMRAAAGVMISASHNPYYDNGIKFFDYQGYKLPDEIEMEIESLLESEDLKKGPTHEQVGKAYRVEDATGRYIEYLKTTFPKDLTLEGFKIVVDCAHGAAYHVAPTVFEELGAEVVAIGVEPNGLNINAQSGALYPEALQEKVKAEGADLGIALDGDADRLVLVDERGEILHGDVLLALCARDLQERGNLAQNTVVATVMSNLGLELSLQDWGIRLHRVQVGDRYVIEAMRQQRFNFGGEQSGHLIFSDYSTTGDGILAALQLMSILKRKKTVLSRFSEGVRIFPQVLLNVRIQERRDLQQVPEMQRLQAGIQKSLGEKGRLLLRYSGTEPLLRIMLEGEDKTKIEAYAQDLKTEAEKVLGRG
ncbi:MAG TPA: phosphoglucosamine mutase [Deltaproteobacteria bacterium]|nr:phosphoglucosamine mutase [Deltaproteobacteria bacterium]